ncbi:signal peptidase I [Rickettsiales endosymbiont of Peranema trichophorum]|uniref:signal peptidase I n=1 Tax=Rickettsiales endosymbiont of Peranema trichophorum TaxID=2486577 RepID=UPI00102323B4|nr:signal peptidase I [Rickettsiales endosymbiont of Peranema trichophorum]RZI47330.1 signal peptidase I [Rickettsiales endosymbiont of Peranema trichophorum]
MSIYQKILGDGTRTLRIRRVLHLEYWLNFLKSVLYAVVLAVIFRSFCYEPYQIPTGSMKPTLLVGDYLFLAKYSYGYSRYSLPFGLPVINQRVFFKQPKRGDVVVFALPTDTSQKYIKRLIGLPGDSVQIIRGVLHINGVPVERTIIGSFKDVDTGAVSNVYQEKLDNGVAYRTLWTGINLDAFPATTPVYKVPKRHYLCLGDNRGDSVDSRFSDKVGFIPEENLVGRVVFMFMTKDFSLIDFIKNLDAGRALRRFQYSSQPD